MDKKLLAAAGAFVSVFTLGSLATTLITSTAANAASTTTTTAADTAVTDTAPTTTPPAPEQRNPSKGGHMANGITETLLTGDTADRAKAAALAAVPGGTIERVENDAEGATYEAHITKSDGSKVTVKMDSSFKVTGTETGHGGHGGR